MKQPLTFQEIILRLQDYWARWGCLIWQPYYTQVGAGTNNPATYLRVQGPEPWNVAYVEPSVRPDDGRYGENPNRLQMHTQFQVILKPDPGNPQDLYLRSLEALGIDPRAHDIRFVEDNWESPALGAWGLGWEVWLDGQEITQFTYFQQAGGIVLDPVSVEITYGLERIAMALQNVRNFQKIQWNKQRTYGDVHLQGEQEHSRYYFEAADIERNRELFRLYEEEARSALAAGLVLPAHDYVLKCSHTFNVLDTRGAIGVTERQTLFGRMRELSHLVAQAYLNQRQQLGFPWLAGVEPCDDPPRSFAGAAASSAGGDFLLEIGCEELPVADLTSALEQLRQRVPGWLDELRLGHSEVRVQGTPRRLAVMVADLAGMQESRTSLVKGPPAARAFDASGQPTPAAIGFARSRGLDVSQLQVREMDGGRYAAAEVHEAGKPAGEVLSQALPGLIEGIKFDKAMRWNASQVVFSRPLRWFVALLGNEVIPFSYAGLHSGRVTHGLRFYQPDTFELASPSDYLPALRGQGILLDEVERRKEIRRQVEAELEKAGGAMEISEDLLAEVTALVEAPTALSGTIEEDHLRLPVAVLVSVMKKHQRYFPMYAGTERLLPGFVAVRNGDRQYLDLVADGNSQVVRARFSDANFFVSEDLGQPLADYLPRLGTLTFQHKLGSMLDKSLRMTRLVEKIAPALGLAGAELGWALRAAELSKADLVTHMVIEMTSLQGVMGEYYALRSGEAPETARAIAEQSGLAVGTADRLDSLCGLFAAGLAPTGTRDPFALRRAALQLVQSLIHHALHFDVARALELAAEGLPISAPAESRKAAADFVTGRLRSYLQDECGQRFDVVDAVLAEQGYDPFGAWTAASQLTNWVSRPDWTELLQAYARCVRITRDQKDIYPVDPALLREPAEQELLEKLSQAESDPAKGSIDHLGSQIEMLSQAINGFFEAVMVMAEDPALRASRLGLLQRVAALSKGTADLSRLEGF